MSGREMKLKILALFYTLIYIEFLLHDVFLTSLASFETRHECYAPNLWQGREPSNPTSPANPAIYNKPLSWIQTRMVSADNSESFVLGTRSRLRSLSDLLLHLKLHLPSQGIAS
jgi:hypothetical protein